MRQPPPPRRPEALRLPVPPCAADDRAACGFAPAVVTERARRKRRLPRAGFVSRRARRLPIRVWPKRQDHLGRALHALLFAKEINQAAALPLRDINEEDVRHATRRGAQDLLQHGALDQEDRKREDDPDSECGDDERRLIARPVEVREAVANAGRSADRKPAQQLRRADQHQLAEAGKNEQADQEPAGEPRANAGGTAWVASGKRGGQKGESGGDDGNARWRRARNGVGARASSFGLRAYRGAE